MRPVGELAAFIGGFVAAEGTFLAGSRFAFAVGLGASDLGTCEFLKEWFDVGRIQHSPRRRAHYDDEVTFRVDRIADLVTVIVPFMDQHLPHSYKRQQYDAWRASILDYWENEAKRRRPCTVEGCTQTRRAKGLCRRHYFDRFGA